jgi:endoglucanase
MENFASERGKAVAEVKRRIDFLQAKKVNFVRLLLETNEAEEYRNYLASPVYRQEVQEIMAYLDSKPGIVVLLSVWMDPSLDALGLPTTTPPAGKVTSTRQILEALVDDFGKYPRVMWGLSNEPHTTSAAEDQTGWTRMNDLVAAIRAKEAQTGSSEHVIAVQGLRDWARDLSYYVTHPITAGGGKNVVYEAHQYNPKSEFGRYFLNAATTLPVIIGEFDRTNHIDQ